MKKYILIEILAIVILFAIGMWPIGVILGIVFLILNHEKKESQKRYELEKYKAETDRMKAEAAQRQKESDQTDL